MDTVGKGELISWNCAYLIEEYNDFKYFKTVMFCNYKRRTNTGLRCIIRSWKREEPENEHRKEVFIMKKSEKIIFTIFKTVYFMCLIAFVIAYITELVSPTAAYCSITSSDWFTLGLMSCVYVLIADKQKKDNDPENN